MSSDSKPVLSLVAIDDDADSLALIKGALKQERLEIVTATDPCAGLDLVLRRRPEVVLLDLMMPKMNGMEVLERILNAAPETDVILITGYYSTDSAVEAIRRGACDYLIKPLAIPVLRDKIGKLVDEAQRRRQAVQLDSELLKTHRFEGIVGRSPLMLQVFERIRRVAPHFRTTLIVGATGTGKELVAHALHRLSPASRGRFAVCNCSAVVETLFESELFGHIKGAFTGATQDKVGLFEYADGGTVFLDEIGDMPLDTQSKLLRVLESSELQRVGSPSVRRVDVRIVSATNRDLDELMSKKQFREDLYYRLSTVEIVLPRLAERKEDLPLLERHFIEQYAAQYNKVIRRITPRAQVLLARYSWPGNVRELRSVLGSACMMAEGEAIDVCDLQENFRNRVAQKADGGEGWLTLAEMERRYIMSVLDSVNGSKTHAARILGIHRGHDIPAAGGNRPGANISRQNGGRELIWFFHPGFRSVRPHCNWYAPRRFAGLSRFRLGHWAGPARPMVTIWQASSAGVSSSGTAGSECRPARGRWSDRCLDSLRQPLMSRHHGCRADRSSAQQAFRAMDTGLDALRGRAQTGRDICRA